MATDRSGRRARQRRHKERAKWRKVRRRLLPFVRVQVLTPEQVRDTMRIVAEDLRNYELELRNVALGRSSGGPTSESSGS